MAYDFTFTPVEKFDTDVILVTMWDYKNNVWTNYFYDALLIDEDDNRNDLQPETPLTPESENTIVDSLDDVIPEPQLLPAWIKTNAKFWSQDQIDDAPLH